MDKMKECPPAGTAGEPDLAGSRDDVAEIIRAQLDALLNEGLEESFPASDPPSVLRGGRSEPDSSARRP